MPPNSSSSRRRVNASEPSVRHDLPHARVGDATRLLKTLSSESRLRILCALGSGESSVSGLADLVGAAQPAVSQHLARMRAEGLVATRRDGQTIYYRVADPDVTRIIEVLCSIFGGRTSDS